MGGVLKSTGGVGVDAPPARSRVTATTALRGTVPRRRTVVLPPPGNRPAGLGAPPFGITRLVGLAARRGRKPLRCEAWRSPVRGATTEAAIFCAGSTGSPGRQPGRQRCGAPPLRRRREPARDPAARRSGTTFERSACRRVQDRRAQPRGRNGATVANQSVAVSLSWRAARGPRTGSGAARRPRPPSGSSVERVGGGQVVGVHDVSVPGSPSSSRMRDSPPNIRLLMVPSGSPSLSASSDWVNPP